MSIPQSYAVAMRQLLEVGFMGSLLFAGAMLRLRGEVSSVEYELDQKDAHLLYSSTTFYPPVHS